MALVKVVRVVAYCLVIGFPLRPERPEVLVSTNGIWNDHRSSKRIQRERGAGTPKRPEFISPFVFSSAKVLHEPQDLTDSPAGNSKEYDLIVDSVFEDCDFLKKIL